VGGTFPHFQYEAIPLKVEIVNSPNGSNDALRNLECEIQCLRMRLSQLEMTIQQNKPSG